MIFLFRLLQALFWCAKCPSLWNKQTNKQTNKKTNKQKKQQQQKTEEIRKALDNDEFTSGAILDFQKQGIIPKKYGRIGKTKNRKQKTDVPKARQPLGSAVSPLAP